MKLVRLRAVSVWFFICTFVLTSCLGPKPTSTPIPLDEQRIAPVGAPTDSIPPMPDLVPDLRCTTANDCVFAYRNDRCCHCGQIFNRTQVADDPRLGYVYGADRTLNPGLCAHIMCEPCQAPPLGLVCDAGLCREAQTWEEILLVCPQKTVDLTTGCFVKAALAAYQSGETERAVAICNSEDLVVLADVEHCLMWLARTIMTEDARQAVNFCRAHINDTLAKCLGESAQELAKSDVEAGLALCTEISPQYPGDREQDICFHNIAMLVAPVDLERAQQICEQMSMDVDQCKQTASRP